MKNTEEIRKMLADAGQEQLLRFWDELTPAGRENLSKQLEEIDFAALAGLIPEYVLKKPETRIPADLGPAEFFPLHPRDAAQEQLYREADARGVELLRAGRVSCLTVAGGQGTRLGFDGPKGTYPIGPVTQRTLFEYFAASILRAGEKYGHAITWYIMTSPINRAATEAFFAEHNWLGLKKEQIFFFTQGTMPAIGYDGKMLLASRDSLSLSPDGHGGTLLALRKSGALDRMAAEGTDIISYFQVDNPLIPVVSPRFIGMHALEKADMSAIMLAKTGPFEKLGNFCVSNGHTQIIEYSDLPAELAEKRNPDGSLAFLAGSPAIHIFSRAFVEQLTSSGCLRLPWHRADKKVPCIDAAGNPVNPETPNAVKLESFIFDALPLAGKVMILEGDRAELFAPTKNRTGVDSAESCRKMITARNARRLGAAGVDIPRNAAGEVDAVIELSPRLVLDDADAVEYVRKHGPVCIARGESVVLE